MVVGGEGRGGREEEEVELVKDASGERLFTGPEVRCLARPWWGW
jgi:hypothetical protein